jgi:hypothetical protein
MQSALEQCRPDRDPPVTRPEAIRGMIDAMLHILAKQPGEKPTKKAKGNERISQAKAFSGSA